MLLIKRAANDILTTVLNLRNITASCAQKMGALNS